MAEFDVPAPEPAAPERPRRGRPPGSKNKPKPPAECAEAAIADTAGAVADAVQPEIPGDLSIPAFMDRTQEAETRS